MLADTKAIKNARGKVSYCLPHSKYGKYENPGRDSVTV